MLSRTDKINALWNSSLFVILSILGFVNFTLNVKTFGTELYGAFLILNVIFGIGSNLDFGFGVSTVKQIAEHKKNFDEFEINVLIFTFIFIFILLSLILFSVFSVYYLYFLRNNTLFPNDNVFDKDKIFILLNISFVFRYITSYIVKVFEGFAEFVLLSKANLILACLNTLSMLILYIYHLTLFDLALVIALNAGLSMIVLTSVLMNKFKFIRPGFRFFSLNVLRKNMTHSINIQLSFLIGSFIDVLMKFSIGKFLNLSYVTYYETAKRIIDISNGMIYSAQKGLLNKLSEAFAENKLADFVNNNLYVYSQLANRFSVLFYGIVNPLLCFFVFYWFHYYDAMVIMLIFMPTYSLINFAGSAYMVFWVEGNGKRLLVIQSLNVLITSGMLYFTLSIFNSYLGIFSFYFSSVISILIVFRYLKITLGFEIIKYLKKTEFLEIFKLNIIIIIQVLAVYYYSEYFNYLLILFTAIYIIIFNSQLKYILKFLNKKLSFLKV